MKRVYLSLDIGGTWVKGIAVPCKDRIEEYKINPEEIKRVKSRLGVNKTADDFIAALQELMDILVCPDCKVCAIGISVAGIVDYAGTKILFSADHLAPLRGSKWIDWLKDKYHVPVVLSNDADAAAVGAAAAGYLKGFRTIGVMPIGTGLGFSLWRNGRRWAPFYSHPLLGSIETPAGSYDELASASLLASVHPDNNLVAVFKEEAYQKEVESYLERLVQIIRTTYYLFRTDLILIGGGLAHVVQIADYPLVERLTTKLQKEPVLTGDTIEIRLMPEANELPLLGMLLIAAGEQHAQSLQNIPEYKTLVTEEPYDSSIHLHKMGTTELASLLWKTEQEAGNILSESLTDIAEAADRIADCLSKGGRLIYVGAGTSGRLAAVDTVEIACTFGFPREHVLTLIAGGVADAAIDIETNFEEDASSVPEMVLANVSEKDVVIGISVSGCAYFVQSALAYAKTVGAYSVFIQEDVSSVPFSDKVIALRTGNEVVAGSTRMKAGTATKKVLNFLSTIAMIRLGKVHGSYMTEMECINNKLIQRAKKILHVLFQLPEEEAVRLLESHNYKLNDVIKELL
ncbi:N-acetylmuramic acid 6-phosphate etherase [Parabacteroides bouchesdurhonensis]|uniref:N-acetylmuramic acid 6-phosphate etherase n=1 Tax=Parabacteroides bouchesdurhonensis TaxID=1936995 RepID=UPI000C835649|nr:N-acetylmuramic acid 6-phosphate etherase [Parabacteroides bouchesdurhonensis]